MKTIENLVNGVELDDTERAIFGAAYVASLMNPNLRPPAGITMTYEHNGAPAQPVQSLTFAAWAVMQYRTDAGAARPLENA